MEDHERKAAGWPEYERLVMTELERCGTRLDSIDKTLLKIQTNVAVIKIKAGIYGIFAGAIPGIATAGYFLIKSI